MSVAFIDNTAIEFGGAMRLFGSNTVQVSGVSFIANSAELGGAVYIALMNEKYTEFTASNFDGNRAADGGAVYLYTGTGVDVFSSSGFRGNIARELP